MTTFYLVRHAHAHWCSDEHRDLWPQGCQASMNRGSDLSRCPITRIISSPYQRAQATVDALSMATGISVVLEGDLCERAPGHFDDLEVVRAVQAV